MLVLYSWPREYLIYAYQAGFLTYSIPSGLPIFL